MEDLILIADAGPLLHLYWIQASEWALPCLPIVVPASVAREVEAYTADILSHPHLRIVHDPPPDARVLRARLGAGETAALSLALAQPEPAAVRLLCDDLAARRAAEGVGIAVLGSLGLIIRAFDAGRVTRGEAVTAVLALPRQGRLHVRPELLRDVIEAIENS